MAENKELEAVVDKIAAEESWNKRVALIRMIPEDFGKARHQEAYAAIAKAVYVPQLGPDFAYIHWRDEYELKPIENAYDLAFTLTGGFEMIDADSLADVIAKEPTTLRIFRLLLGFTTQELSASTAVVAEQNGGKGVSNGSIKSLEEGSRASKAAAGLLGATIDAIMRGTLFPEAVGDVRSKVKKPDTVDGWKTVRKFAKNNVPFPVFLHQRHYGGAFRQLLDATSGKRGDLLEDAVSEIFEENGIKFVKTGSSNQAAIARDFGLTVKPAPDFVVHDSNNTLKAILECKQANDGGTARDKAARFAALRTEAARLGGVPVFAILAGLGWRRTADTLGPVVRDTDGRVFTLHTLPSMLSCEPFPPLIKKK